MTTNELENNIKSADKLSVFLEEHSENFVATSLSNHLISLMIEKNLDKRDVVKNSNLNLNYVYQIFNGRRNAQRDKLIMLAFGLKLDTEETERLLKIANVSILYAKDRRDSIILYALHNKLSIIDLNIELHKENYQTLQ